MKYSVLTCIFGNYEVLRQPCVVDPECEYICVTDRDDLDRTGAWKIRHLNPILRTMPFTNQWTYVRFHPFDFVSNDICIYMDGSIQIFGDGLQNVFVKPFVEGDFVYGIMPPINQVECNIRYDIGHWETYRDLNPETANKIRRYLDENDYHIDGMLQSGFLMYKNCQECDIINNTAWELCHLWGYDGCTVDRNNQIDLSYTVNRLFYQSNRIFRISGLMLDSTILRIYLHGSTEVSWTRTGTDESVFCDKLMLNHVIRTPELVPND